MRIVLNLATAVTLLAAASLAQAGCFRCAPILNVTDAPVTSASGASLSDEQVKSAIIRAGAALGWQMREVAPGKLMASIALRSHSAQVEIPYSPKQYSITYKSSTNLDEGDGEIHKNYNGWIQNLSRGINAQLSAG